MKRFILIRGPPASGKTTIARCLRDVLGKAVMFDADHFVRCFGGNASSLSDKYLAYEIILRICRDFFVKDGWDIIIGDSLLVEKRTDLFTKFFEKYGYTSYIFTLTSDFETLTERYKFRERCDALEDEKIKKLMYTFDDAESKTVVIDTRKISKKRALKIILETLYQKS